MRIFGFWIRDTKCIFLNLKVLNEKLQSASFHDNLVAMYYIENSWCEDVPNTVLAVAVLGGV